MQLFYNPDINVSTNIFSIDKNESRHIMKVLGKKERDQLQITNGKGMLFNSEIINANDKKCAIQIISAQLQPKPWTYHLHIAIAPTKMNDRYEWFLEKATEIGVFEIVPLLCKNNERDKVNFERCKKVELAANKQSQRAWLPVINEPMKFSQLICQDNLPETKLIAYCEDLPEQSMDDFVGQPDVLVLIGPEGDFTKEEVAMAESKGFVRVNLGVNRLRTETAGIVAVAKLNQ